MLLKTPIPNLIIKLFIVFSFIVCWLSISTSFDDLLILQKKNNLDISIIINFLRHGLVYLNLFISLILFFTLREYFFNKKFIIFYIIIAYFLAQIPGLLYTENNYTNISYIISSLAVIFTLILSNYFFSYDEKKVFIFISFSILLFVFLISFTPKFIDFLDGGKKLYGYYYTSDFFLQKTTPRSSGVSRTCLIIFLLTYVFQSIYIKKKLLITIFNIFLLSVILLLQSRTNIFLTFVACIFIFIFEKQYSTKDIFKFIFIYFLLPILAVIIFTNINTYNKFKKFKYSEIGPGNEYMFEKDLSLNSYNDFMISVGPGNVRNIPVRSFSKDISSGRYDDWKNIIYKILNKQHVYFTYGNEINFYLINFFGYGSQGDRYLIKQSASNGLVYALASSGITGIFLFSIFSILLFFKLCVFAIYSYNNNNHKYIFCVIIFLLLLRSILESSYAVFSIDFMILITLLNSINDSEVNVNDLKIKI